MKDLKSLFFENVADFLSRHSILGEFSKEKLWESLSSLDISSLELGLKSGSWAFKGKFLHSQRNPQREAERSAREFSSAESIIALSLGAGYFLEVLDKRVKSVLLIESDTYLLAAFFLNGSFKKFSGKITLFFNSLERFDALEEILPWLQGKNLKRTQIYYHTIVHELNKAQLTRAYERVTQLFEKRSVNQATIIKFQALWNKNIFLNRLAMQDGITLSSLLTKPAPEVIVVAGAGPSLSYSFSELKKYRDSFILFAADTAFIPLAKTGVFADFVFSADPQWVNHYFAQTSLAARATWVVDPVVCPPILRQIKRLGTRTVFWNNVFLADSYFRTMDRGDVAHGGSVSTNAFDVARQWLSLRSEKNLARLILVGQDLSFSNRQAHVKGAVLEEQVFIRNNRLQGFERHNWRQMMAMRTEWRRGIQGDMVRTNGKLLMFCDWFEMQVQNIDKEKIRLINATHAGAFLKGYEHLSLGAALKGVNPSPKPTLPNPEKSLLKPLSSLWEDLRKAERLLKDNLNLAAKKNPTATDLSLLNKNDEKFRALGFAKDIISLNAQAIILKITEEGADVDAVEFYRAMARAARAVAHWVKKVS
ncbi:MAG: hypothetical protein LDLANPLL_02435 [Turneriella sp.]|nr:hypothetical protein [Turneriella sp.]